jgi:hypothetical protein
MKVADPKRILGVPDGGDYHRAFCAFRSLHFADPSLELPIGADQRVQAWNSAHDGGGGGAALWFPAKLPKVALLRTFVGGLDDLDASTGERCAVATELGVFVGHPLMRRGDVAAAGEAIVGQVLASSSLQVFEKPREQKVSTGIPVRLVRPHLLLRQNVFQTSLPLRIDASLLGVLTIGQGFQLGRGVGFPCQVLVQMLALLGAGT